jgi:hypothetical protein
MSNTENLLENGTMTTTENNTSIGSNLVIQQVEELTTTTPVITYPSDYSKEGYVLISQEAVKNINGKTFFTNQVKLSYLKESDNTELTQFGCRQCYETFNTQQKLGFHIGSVHNKKVFTLGTKGMKFKTDKATTIVELLNDLIKERDDLKAELSKQDKPQTKKNAELIEEREYWKSEYKKQKQELETLKKSLGLLRNALGLDN